MKLVSLSLVAALFVGVELRAADWTIDSADDWTKNIKSAGGAIVADGSVSPEAKTATIVTKVHASDIKRSAKSLVVTQSAIWQNWNPIENLGPANLGDAPVLLTVGPDNYWMFGRYGGGQARRKGGRRQSLCRLSNRKKQRWKGSTSRCKPRGFTISSTRPVG